MRNAQKIIGIISERGKHQKPLRRLYRQLYNPQLYLEAYKNIHANDGAMTQGTTDETVDGMSMKKIMSIITKLKQETYYWTPVRRTYVKKRNGKQRPLGLPTWSDKLLQEVMRMLLEAYYDCQFSDDSHGFRKNKGCKTALEIIGHKEHGWMGIKWFIEGDVSNCFGCINHQILLNVLSEKIDDKRFLRLIENFLKCGYMEDWKYNKTMSGCPQGGILSPLLSNVYLNQFDQYVKNVVIPKYNTGKRRTLNKEYSALLEQKRKYKHHGNWDKVKEFKKLTQKMPSIDPSDPNFKRLRYIRYADDWLIGLIGSKKDAEIIKTELSTYLHRELQLELNQSKTLITHARTEKARFLSYDIEVMHSETRHDRRGHRSINGKTRLMVPKDKLQAKMSKYMAKGKPIHRKELTINSDYDIISQYQAEFRGFAQYYLAANNVSRVYDVKWVMEISLAKTLACKHKSTVKKIFRKYRAYIETEAGVFRVLQVEVKRDGRKSLFAYFGGIKLAQSGATDIDDVPKREYNVRTQLIDRLTRNVCELCGSNEEVEMHHVRKLKNLRRIGQRDKSLWMIRMIAMNRKTLAVCSRCHLQIHAGKYDGVRVR